MICARKIHDEFNIFEGVHTNFMFIIVWFLILGLQIVITQVGGVVFVVNTFGLSFKQWVEAVGISLTVFIVNAILKCLPDYLFPKLGKDSVDERRAEQAKGN